MRRAKATEKIERPKTKYSEGEEIMARWPGSKLWFEAVVLSTNYEDDLFHLRFPDGQENEVPFSHLAVCLTSLCNVFQIERRRSIGQILRPITCT